MPSIFGMRRSLSTSVTGAFRGLERLDAVSGLAPEPIARIRCTSTRRSRGSSSTIRHVDASPPLVR